MLIYRILSALIGIPLLLGAVWLGNWYLTIVIALLAILGVKEFHDIAVKMQVNPWLPGMLFAVLIFVLVPMVPLLEVGLVFVLVLWVFLFRTIGGSRFNFKDAAVSLFGSLYVGWLMSHLLLLRQSNDGLHYVFLIFIATWLTDTMAYFVGMNFGRHKLAPGISPNKTVEGALGGVAGSILGSLGLAFLVSAPSMVHFAVIGALVGIIGQAGDLIESAMKRVAGIKDSGNIIPGHGGILDRFDSLLFTAPLVYYYVQVFIIN